MVAEDGSADRVLDGIPETFWHSRWEGGKDPLPHRLVIDLGEATQVSGIQYLPRQDKAHGRIGEYRVFASPTTLPGL